MREVYILADNKQETHKRIMWLVCWILYIKCLEGLGQGRSAEHSIK